MDKDIAVTLMQYLLEVRRDVIAIKDALAIGDSRRSNKELCDFLDKKIPILQKGVGNA